MASSMELEDPKPEKEIYCNFCGSRKVTAKIGLANEPERPHIQIACADCEVGGQGLIGLEVTVDSVKFIFWSEDMAERLKKKDME